MPLKIGELARRTGLTVRTLHHYDAIGLLKPSERSDAGYRLYNRQDIERLHRIQVLRRLDLPLADIAALLEGDASDLQTVIEQQIAALERQLARTVTLRDRLRGLLAHVASEREPELSEWLTTLEMMTLYDKYFTREELDDLRRRGSDLGRELVALGMQVKDVMARGLPPESADAQALCKPWLTLALQHMGGDARMMLKLDALHRNENRAQVLTGVDSATLDYMTRATAHYRFNLYARDLEADEIARVRDGYFRNYERWPALFAQLRQLHDEGASPQDEAMQDLCARWLHLFTDSWGDDPAVREKIREANRRLPDLLTGTGMTPQLLDFLQAGMTCLHSQTRKLST